jgi:hypothetical protein
MVSGRTGFVTKVLLARAFMLLGTALRTKRRPGAAERLRTTTMIGRAKVSARSTELLRRHTTFHAAMRRTAFMTLAAMHHGRTFAAIRATKAVPATARTFRAVHLGAARALAEMLWRALTTLIGMELALRTFATRLMLSLRTPHVTGSLLAASMFIATRSFRATGVFIARTGRRWHIATTGIRATLGFRAATISVTALGITTLGFRTAAISVTAFGIATLWLRAFGLGIAAGRIGTAFGAGSRCIGATRFG